MVHKSAQVSSHRFIDAELHTQSLIKRGAPGSKYRSHARCQYCGTQASAWYNCAHPNCDVPLHYPTSGLRWPCADRFHSARHSHLCWLDASAAARKDGTWKEDQMVTAVKKVHAERTKPKETTGLRKRATYAFSESETDVPAQPKKMSKQ